MGLQSQFNIVQHTEQMNVPQCEKFNPYFNKKTYNDHDTTVSLIKSAVPLSNNSRPAQDSDVPMIVLALQLPEYSISYRHT